MRVTTAQVFQVGTILIGFVTVVLAFVPGLDAGIVGKIGAATGVAWGSIGTVLTGPQAQAQSVAANIEDPNVKETLVRKVSQLPGLEPLAINAQADDTLKKLAASALPENAKIG